MELRNEVKIAMEKGTLQGVAIALISMGVAQVQGGDTLGGAVIALIGFGILVYKERQDELQKSSKTQGRSVK
jgi:hypothetical protein